MRSSSLPGLRQTQPGTRPPTAGKILLLVAILLAGLALRLRGNGYALWYDEIAATRFAAEPLSRLWSSWMVYETNPPLYYSLLKLWIGLAGDGDAAIRTLSAVIGVAGLAAMAGLGRAVGGWRTALIAAALLALSPQHILYSQQARGYILAHTGCLIALIGLSRFAQSWHSGERGRVARALAVYVIGSAIAVYSHTMLVLLPALANLWALACYGQEWSARRRLPAHWQCWLGANLGLLLVWAWWAAITLRQSATMGANIGWMVRPSLPYAVRMTFESYLPWGLGAASFLGVLLYAGLFGWGLWRMPDRRLALLLAVVALGAPAVLFALSLVRPVFLPRTVYFAAAAFLVVVAAGIASLPRRWGAGALVVALLLQTAAYGAWYRDRESEPWRALATAIGRAGPGEVLIVPGVGPAFALARYCAQPACDKQIVVLGSPRVDHWSDGMDRPRPQSPQELAGALAGRCRALILRWAGDDPLAAVRPVPGMAGPERRWGPGGPLGLREWRRSGSGCGGPDNR